MQCNCTYCIHRSSCKDWVKLLDATKTVGTFLGEHYCCDHYSHQQGIPPERVVDVMCKAYNANAGDEATQYILVSICAAILGCEVDELEIPMTIRRLCDEK